MQYESILIKKSPKTIDEVWQLFWSEVSSDWSNHYASLFPKHGEITLQNFIGFSFVIDHVWLCKEEDVKDLDLPETRVVGAFGIANININSKNRSIMRSYWGNTSKAFNHYGHEYDKGHFIAHGFGGPIDVNLFPQRRDINRGWSIEGKRYRAMERYVASHPGTLVFSRPIYNDLSCCPSELEYGYCTTELKIVVETFPNQ